MDMNDTLINRMYGYAQPMQADFTRDSVTPLDTSKELTFKVNPYDSEVKSFLMRSVHLMEVKSLKIRRLRIL